MIRRRLLTCLAAKLSIDPDHQTQSLEARVVSELQGIGRFQFHDGELGEFKRLAAQSMEIVRANDSGTLQYDIYFNDDQSECIVLERYRDSEALIEHAALLGDLGEAIFATGWVSGELLGEPSAELKARMVGSGVRAFTPYQSMQHRSPAWARLLRAVAALRRETSAAD